MDEEDAAVLFLRKTFGPDEDVYISSYPLEQVMSEIKHASPHVRRFLNGRCRTVEDLEEYLNSYEDEDYFWVENGRMTLYYDFVSEGKDNAVSYFEDILETYEIRPHFRNLYGHNSQADEDVQDFLRLFYPGDFEQFLLNHSDVFVVFTDDRVSLKEKEAVKYFQQRLQENREGWYYMNLRGCIGQAPRYLIDFMNEHYHEEDFLQFLENNSLYFSVDEEECVYLEEIYDNLQ